MPGDLAKGEADRRAVHRSRALAVNGTVIAPLPWHTVKSRPLAFSNAGGVRRAFFHPTSKGRPGAATASLGGRLARERARPMRLGARRDLRGKAFPGRRVLLRQAPTFCETGGSCGPQPPGGNRDREGRPRTGIISVSVRSPAPAGSRLSRRRDWQLPGCPNREIPSLAGVASRRPAADNVLPWRSC